MAQPPDEKAIAALARHASGDGPFLYQCDPQIWTLREANFEMTRVYSRSSVAAGQPWVRGDGLEKRLLQAAEGGDAGAQCNLGILYGNGLDDNGYAVEGNRPQAVRWLLAAAEQGLPRAQVKLAEVYAEGPDMSGSHASACGWFLVAAIGLRDIHLHRARSGYERLAGHLTPLQIAGARRFAQNWAPTRPKRAVDLVSSEHPDGRGAL